MTLSWLEFLLWEHRSTRPGVDPQWLTWLEWPPLFAVDGWPLPIFSSLGISRVTISASPIAGFWHQPMPSWSCWAANLSTRHRSNCWAGWVTTRWTLSTKSSRKQFDENKMPIGLHPPTSTAFGISLCVVVQMLLNCQAKHRLVNNNSTLEMSVLPMTRQGELQEAKRSERKVRRTSIPEAMKPMNS